MCSKQAYWSVDRYRDFLAARRELLAAAANTFLDELLEGTAPVYDEVAEPVVALERPALEPVEDHEERVLRECHEWVVSVGLAQGEENFELADPITGEQLALLDLAWPEGLQEGLTEPIALLLNESTEVETAAGARGFRFFTSSEAFRAYVLREVLDETEAA